VFTYQIFHAGDAGHNHEVATADEADRVVTFTFRLDGSTLVGEVVMDFKKTYGSVPAGTKHGIVERYRR
jgi:hypothetical protein